MEPDYDTYTDEQLTEALTYETYTVQQLQESLSNDWKGVEQQNKATMAPKLYYLHEKLLAQGQKGQGFERWVRENTGISISTARRWIYWYVEQISPASDDYEAETSGQMNGSEEKKEDDYEEEEEEKEDEDHKGQEEGDTKDPNAKWAHQVTFMYDTQEEREHVKDLERIVGLNHISQAYRDTLEARVSANTTPVTSQPGDAACAA